MRCIKTLCSVALIGCLSVAYAGGDTGGFLYGKITSESGSTYEGRIRWGNEEAFWGDFFNSVKEDRPFDDLARKQNRKRREPIKVFGITIGVRWDEKYDADRMFKAQFGDIRRIEIHRGDEATLVMKSGNEYEIDGGSNDLGGRIQIWDAGVGKIDLDWDKIDTIEFLPAPRDLDVGVHRLHGTVHTDDGEFRGYIQWDQDECVSTDKLDGENQDGDIALDIGVVRTLERAPRNRSRVTVRDGREFVLGGTNDVNDDNRGIYVNDERYGRVLIPWDEFERVEFSDAGDSGPGYKEFKPGKALRGRVTDRDGNVHSGAIVYDLDESETWELFDGDWRDISYSIPMGRIKSIVPENDDSARVTLEGGEELELEDTADSGSGNAGIMIVPDDGDKIYVPWDEIERIDFSH